MTDLLIVLLLTLINGVFAMSEVAVIAARKARLEKAAEKGDLGARAALTLSHEPTRFLSTVQIGITLVGILLGAFGGATVAGDIARVLRENNILSEYADALSFLVVVIVTTYLQLIIGELVPKRLALRSPESLAGRVARPMQWLSMITAPVVKLLSWSTNAILWLIGAGDTSESPVTEEEISTMIQQGVRAGVFEEAEHEMVESVLKLGERRVTSIMTPRTEVVALDIEDSNDINQAKIAESRFSRFPVCAGSLDNVVGMVRAKDLLPRMLGGEVFDVRAAMVPPVFVPESMTAARVLEIFRETGKHIVFVIGEYGGLQGIVTTQDILEEIVGDIEEPQAILRDDGSYLIDGLMPVEDFKELIEIDELPGEDELFETVAGFVMTHQGKIPQTGDRFTWQDFCFEVVDMDGNRIDKIIVSRTAPPPAEAVELDRK